MCVGLSVYMHHVCAMPIEVRGNIVFLELELQMLWEHYVGAGNRTTVMSFLHNLSSSHTLELLSSDYFITANWKITKSPRDQPLIFNSIALFK